MPTPESSPAKSDTAGAESAMSASPTVPLSKLSGDVVLPEPDALDGKLIGPYKLDRKLGQGGFGSVYHARHGTLNRETAIKLLAKHFAADANFVTRFQREARAAARLEHVGVVQVYDVGEDQGYHYIAMQFVDGTSLERLLDQRGKLTVNEVVSIAKRVAAALEYAHQQGIVHRDIKPGNILISKDSKVKVVDFGLARDLIEAGRVSVTGQIMGTPHFMSPEQGRGDKVDERSDVYALGATMYSMLTGKVPFDGNNAISVIMKHATDAVVPPTELDASIPRPVSDLVVAMMAKDPAGRPQNMGQVAAKLEGMKDGRSSVIAAPLARGSSPALVAPALADPAPALAMTSVTSPAPPRRSRGPWLIAAGALLLLLVGIAVGGSIARKREQPQHSLDAAIDFARNHADDHDAIIAHYREVIAQNPNAPQVTLKAQVLLYQALQAKAHRRPEPGGPDAVEKPNALLAEADHEREALLAAFTHHAADPFAKEAWVAFLQVESDVVKFRAEMFFRHCLMGDMRAARAFIDPNAPDKAGTEDPKNPLLARFRKEGVVNGEGKFLVPVIRDVGRVPELDNQIGRLEGATMKLSVEFKRPRLLKEPDRITKDLPWTFRGDNWYLDPQ